MKLIVAFTGHPVCRILDSAGHYSGGPRRTLQGVDATMTRSPGDVGTHEDNTRGSLPPHGEMTQAWIRLAEQLKAKGK
jgi:hypothetical protein